MSGPYRVERNLPENGGGWQINSSHGHGIVVRFADEHKARAWANALNAAYAAGQAGGVLEGLETCLAIATTRWEAEHNAMPDDRSDGPHAAFLIQAAIQSLIDHAKARSQS